MQSSLWLFSQQRTSPESWVDVSAFLSANSNTGRVRKQSFHGKYVLYMMVTVPKRDQQWDSIARLSGIWISSFERGATSFTKAISNHLYEKIWAPCGGEMVQFRLQCEIKTASRFWFCKIRYVCYVQSEQLTNRKSFKKRSLFFPKIHCTGIRLKHLLCRPNWHLDAPLNTQSLLQIWEFSTKPVFFA